MPTTSGSLPVRYSAWGECFLTDNRRDESLIEPVRAAGHGRPPLLFHTPCEPRHRVGLVETEVQLGEG